MTEPEKLTEGGSLDLSNLLSPVVSLDTNVIRSTKENSPPFQILVELAKAKSVKVVITEIAVEERRTQWREQFLKEAREAKKALSALEGEKVIAEAISGDFVAANGKLDGLDIEELSKERYARFLKDNHFEIYPLTLKDAQTAWEWYFSGKPPFKEVKNRKDIPDAHILAAAQSLAESSPEAYFVVGDKAMFDAATQIKGLLAFETIDELISSEKFVQLRKELDIEKRWQKLKSLVSNTGIKEHVAKFVFDHGDELIEWEDLSHNSIPEDNHTATVHASGTPSSVAVGEVEDWGGGFLRCPVTFSVEALLQFSVFRGDAFDVPDWVSVSLGDFENEHYFDAEGYRMVAVSVDVAIRIDLDALAEASESDVFEIEFEQNSLQLTLANDD